MNMNMMELLTNLVSLIGVLVLFQNQLNLVIPPELRLLFLKLFQRLFNGFSSYCHYEIIDFDSVETNELYKSVQLYLSDSAAAATADRLTLTRGRNSSVITFGLASNDRLPDVFNGVNVVWEHIVTPRQSQPQWRGMSEDKRKFTLRINKKDKARILNDYLEFITQKAKQIKRKNRDRLLYTNSGNESRWDSVSFKHPSTFETLAMDPVKKAEIMSDLRDFADGEAFYKRTGRAWKRGYLLHGPPGTGKSSMIAAMADYLKYDIYDLELTEVKTNSELRKLLMRTSSKSIIVIEDIDCSVDLTNRKKGNSVKSSPDTISGSDGPGVNPENKESNKTITLSGLLNFTDGLWSCCGSERIFIFTTNHIEKLDPALLRSGRMDMHVLMSYCSFPALKVLLKNYLDCDEGDIENGVLEDIAAVIEEAKMTPADIGEELIKNKRDKDKAVRVLLETLRSKVESKKAVEKEVVEEKRALDISEKAGGVTISGANDDLNADYKKGGEDGKESVIS